MKVTIDLNRWHARALFTAETWDSDLSRLLNEKGTMCCLGFACLVHGAKPKNIQEKAYPEEVRNLVKDSWLHNSDLSRTAAEMNDGFDPNTGEKGYNDLPLLMGNLITVFAEGGDVLEFVVGDEHEVRAS
jgi:hypothetical protein